MALLVITSGASLGTVNNYKPQELLISSLSLAGVKHEIPDLLVRGASLGLAGVYDPKTGGTTPFYDMNYKIIRKI